MTLVFLDVETTGRDPDRHEVWEIAYAIDDGPIRSAIVPHTFTNPDPKALAMNGYLDRALDAKPDRAFEDLLRARLDGATIVGANPAFDAAFLRARWGYAPWHHRLWDVEAYAAGVLVLDKVPGLATIAMMLDGLGREIPEPDHSAAGDVATLRACFRALQDLATGQP
jgi:DNA polymerase-3 subunit epsilon